MSVRRGAAAAKKKPKVVEKAALPPSTETTQRQHQRLAVNLLIDYQVLDQFLYDYATNISLGGVFIRSSNPLPVGTKLRVQFSLPPSPVKDRERLVAPACWKEPSAKRTRGRRRA